MVLKALILVGGFGTRLRPLTFSEPKPLVPFCNKAIVLHQVEALVKVGVKEFVLAVNYKPDRMNEFIAMAEAKFGITIKFSLENTPMGTAGPLALAKALLDPNDADAFFVLNSDVICEFPFADFLAFHKNHGKEGTIMVTKVDDPSKYGVVVAQDDGKINSFVEKPQTFVGDKINAGIYVFTKAILERIELRPTSIERETFPAMAADGQLYRFVLPGYWMDVGQPKDNLAGVNMHLDFLRRTNPKELAAQDGNNFTVTGNVLIDPSATIGAGASIGPNVVIGPGVTVASGARVKNSSLFEGVQIKQSAFVDNSIIGWQSRIGAWARVESCILGEDVAVKDDLAIFKTTVCPHKGVKESIRDGRIIL